MIITSFGKTFLTQSEHTILTLDPEEAAFQEQAVAMSKNRKPNVYRCGRIVVKRNSPLLIKSEVEASMRLSTVSPIFLPILAFSDYFLVTPYVDGVLLANTPKHEDRIWRISIQIAEACLIADIYPRDLHGGNVILSNTTFVVVDLERYVPMDTYSRMSVRDLARQIYDVLMEK